MMVPIIIPVPDRAEVIVTELFPVSIDPRVMLSVATLIFAKRITFIADDDLLIVRILKVVTPAIDVLLVHSVRQYSPLDSMYQHY